MNTYVQEVNLIKFITALIISFINVASKSECMYATTEIEIVAAQQLHPHIQVRVTIAALTLTTLFHRPSDNTCCDVLYSHKRHSSLSCIGQ